jgi:hypothetical protein
MDCSTRPSSVRVCQFRHYREFRERYQPTVHRFKWIVMTTSIHSKLMSFACSAIDTNGPVEGRDDGVGQRRQEF